MFRLFEGAFEQIGQAWVKHTIIALSQGLCFGDCRPTNGQHLGVHCSDPHSAAIGGYQPMLGPKFEVDPSAGDHPHPVTDLDLTGDAIYKRLQVHNADLDPALNPGALYFVEGQFIAEDDAAGGNGNNNASYRQVAVFGAGGVFNISLLGETVRGRPAIDAWSAQDPDVVRADLDVPGDGRFIVASKATDLGGGLWRYEYAVHNLNSRRAAGSFRVPLPDGAGPTTVGFHDVDYHSGEPFEGTDWTATVDAGSITWETDPSAVNPQANALRWGTLYNFRFDLDVPPIDGEVALGLFLPGTPSEASAPARVPLPCDSDGTCDLGEACRCLDDCPGEGPDADADLVGSCLDCNDADASVWAAPGAVRDLVVEHHVLTGTTIRWSPPAEPGAESVTYRVLRSPDPERFDGPATECLEAADPANTWASDDRPMTESPQLACYLARAVNDCPEGQGSLGTDSTGAERLGVDCP
jgi:hypothetical protein